VIHESINSVLALHGHNGATRVEYLPEVADVQELNVAPPLMEARLLKALADTDLISKLAQDKSNDWTEELAVLVAAVGGGSHADAVRAAELASGVRDVVFFQAVCQRCGRALGNNLPAPCRTSQDARRLALQCTWQLIEGLLLCPECRAVRAHEAHPDGES
jgi:hypothetical protein